MTEPNEHAAQHNKPHLQNSLIAGLALAAIGIHLLLRFAAPTEAALGPVRVRGIPLQFCLVNRRAYEYLTRISSNVFRQSPFPTWPTLKRVGPALATRCKVGPPEPIDLLPITISYQHIT
jgi:hypothetical protein